MPPNLLKPNGTLNEGGLQLNQPQHILGEEFAGICGRIIIYSNKPAKDIYREVGRVVKAVSGRFPRKIYLSNSKSSCV